MIEIKGKAAEPRFLPSPPIASSPTRSSLGGIVKTLPLASGKTLMIGSKLKQPVPHSLASAKPRARQTKARLHRPHSGDLIALNQHKRDLRTIEQIQLDLKRKLSERETSQRPKPSVSSGETGENKEGSATQSTALGPGSLSCQSKEEHKRAPMLASARKVRRPPNLDQLDRRTLKPPPRLDDILKSSEPGQASVRTPGFASLQQADCVDGGRKDRSSSKDASRQKEKKQSRRMALPADDDNLPAGDAHYYSQNYSAIIRKMFHYDAHKSVG